MARIERRPDASGNLAPPLKGVPLPVPTLGLPRPLRVRRARPLAGTRGPILLAALLAALPVGAQDHLHPVAAEAGSSVEVPLYEDLGTHHRSITTDAPRAQAYFDQGLRLHWAFNHGEAIRSWEAALRHDAKCAMCWWGIALASGPNINGAMEEADALRARDAIRRAMELRNGGTPAERDLIEALAERYSDEPDAARPPLDSAWARAMDRVARRHPDDPEVLSLQADALMNLSPWHYWEGPYTDRVARPGTPEAEQALERALTLDPNHPGACHLFIHLMEAAFPERAVPCADRLAALMPGAGHIVHMPGHIYIRVGRYADAVRANEHAVHTDESWIEDVGIASLYTAGYYPHNYHFLAFAATMAGMEGRALEAARAVAGKVDPAIAADVYWIQNAIVLPQLTLLTFGRWEELLREPAPAEGLPHVDLMMAYARGVAHAALGNRAAAEIERSRVEARRATAGPPEEDPIPHIASLALAGEMALRRGDAEEAAARLAEAAAIEDGLLYEEPPLWYHPVRHALGRALLEAGRPAEAERVLREDLARFPENGWALTGLHRALVDQGRTGEARAVEIRLRAAWKDADRRILSPRF